jgi:TetR/AcrR family transcriptional regulator, transcriptional repressor of bet genes
MTVDHDKRRQKIAEVTAGVISREGLEAATIRRIAAEFAGPTKIITYYFSDKQELLRFTWQYLAHQYFDAVSACGTGNLVDSLTAMAASDDQSILRWRVYAAFVDRATRDPEFAAMQRTHQEVALRLIGQMVLAVAPTCDNIERVSLLLNAMVQGISLQVLVDRERWAGGRVRNALSDFIEILLDLKSSAPKADHLRFETS